MFPTTTLEATNAPRKIKFKNIFYVMASGGLLSDTNTGDVHVTKDPGLAKTGVVAISRMNPESKAMA